MSNEYQTFWEDCRENRFDLTMTLGNVGEIEKADFTEIFKSMNFGKNPPAKFSIMDDPDTAVELIIDNQSVTFAVIYVLIKDQLPKFDEQIAEWKKSVGRGDEPITDKDREAWFLSGIGGKQLQTGREALIGAIGNFFLDRKTDFSNLIEQHKQMVLATTEGRLKIQQKRVEDVKYILEKEAEEGSKEIRERVEKALRAGDYTSLSSESSDSPQTA